MIKFKPNSVLTKINKVGTKAFVLFINDKKYFLNGVITDADDTVNYCNYSDIAIYDSNDNEVTHKMIDASGNLKMTLMLNYKVELDKTLYTKGFTNPDEKDLNKKHCYKMVATDENGNSYTLNFIFEFKNDVVLSTGYSYITEENLIIPSTINEIKGKQIYSIYHDKESFFIKFVDTTKIKVAIEIIELGSIFKHSEKYAKVFGCFYKNRLSSLFVKDIIYNAPLPEIMNVEYKKVDPFCYRVLEIVLIDLDTGEESSVYLVWINAESADNMSRSDKPEIIKENTNVKYAYCFSNISKGE